MSPYQPDRAKHQHSRNAHSDGGFGECDVYRIQQNEHNGGEQAVDSEHHRHSKEVVQPYRGDCRHCKQRQQDDVDYFDQHLLLRLIQPWLANTMYRSTRECMRG